MEEATISMAMHNQKQAHRHMPPAKSKQGKASFLPPSPLLPGLCDHIITPDSILFNCSLLNSNQPIINHNYSLIQGHNSYFIVC